MTCCCHFSSGSHRTHNDGHQAGTLNSLCYGQAVPAGSPGIIFITTPTPATSTPTVLQNCTRHYFHPLSPSPFRDLARSRSSSLLKSVPRLGPGFRWDDDGFYLLGLDANFYDETFRRSRFQGLSKMTTTTTL